MLLENILKELRKKFNHLKVLITNNSFTLEEVRIEINKIIFTLNILKQTLVKNETAFSAAQLAKVNYFLSEIKNLKELVPELFEGIDTTNILAEELKEMLPERIKTDDWKNDISL